MAEELQSTENSTQNQNLVKELSNLNQKPSLKQILVPAGIILGIILAGGVTGYFLARGGGGRRLSGGARVIQGAKEVGIKDTKTFRDTAEGKIDINDRKLVPEGSHKLLRPGGPNQTAYLTSSVVDLNQFVGKCVQVWGETFASAKAGWLMDVGRVKILDSCPSGI